MMAMIVSMFPASAFAVTVDKSYMLGTYTGEAIGYDNGKVTVTVKLEADSEGNTVISDIEADGSTQTQSVWEKAKAVLSQIKEKNGTDDIDTVSGSQAGRYCCITCKGDWSNNNKRYSSQC